MRAPAPLINPRRVLRRKVERSEELKGLARPDTWLVLRPKRQCPGDRSSAKVRDWLLYAVCCTNILRPTTPRATAETLLLLSAGPRNPLLATKWPPPCLKTLAATLLKAPTGHFYSLLMAARPFPPAGCRFFGNFRRVPAENTSRHEDESSTAQGNERHGGMAVGCVESFGVRGPYACAMP